MAVIDTSGSMGADVLSDISAELAKLNRTHTVTVVEADDRIHDVYPYRPILEVRGHGGTDFRPVFEREFLHKQHPDLIIYFTDGFGQAPVSPPSMPVIWAITQCGKRPCSWGRLL